MMPARWMILLGLLCAATLVQAQEERCMTCRDETCAFLTDLPPCSKPSGTKPPKEKGRKVRTRDSARPGKPPTGEPAPVTPPPSPSPDPTPEPPSKPQELPPAAEGVQATPPSQGPAATSAPLQVFEQPERRSRFPEGRQPLRSAAIGLAISGWVLAAGGAVLLGLDRRFGQECWQPGDVTTCPQVYTTLGPGAALVAVGGAALIGSVVLFAVDRRRQHKVAILWPRLGARASVAAAAAAADADDRELAGRYDRKLWIALNGEGGVPSR
ncbi:MAG: hypothetical protein RMK29_21500 [Myxococcales bacterium]|nr:hypothetical protein [Myxococcales bacterium]